MREFARRKVDDRAAFFSEAAARRNVPGWMIEKDFWVSWVLQELFQLEPLRNHLVFKGGTSLSKVFNVIERFSEDIDLSISPEFLGFTESWFEDEPSSRAERVRRCKKLEEACIVATEKRFMPLFSDAITAQLGKPADDGWNLKFQIDEISQSPVVIFRFPAAARYGGYVPSEVKIELGSLTDQRPTGSHTVTPMIVGEYAQAFSQPTAQVVALEAERTFWEKATILHVEYHRPASSLMRPRYSRHYSDTAALALHPLGHQATQNFDLLARVVRHKSMFFASGWANYATAVPGTLRLVPPDSRLPELEDDYAKMADMFLTPPPAFSAVMATLSATEKAINAAR